MTNSVVLAKLKLSPINVRKSDDLQIEPLAAALLAHGVLQNLLITPSGRSKTVFDVFDGGRRLRALQLLAEQGHIDADTYTVPVKVLKGDDATLSETSLIANFHQLKMTPAEECRAFQHFLGQDGDIEGVARRFGQTMRFIEGRLRLASLVEPIFNSLASGKLSLDKAKAYASTDNHEKQLRAFSAYGASDYYNADTIRRSIAGDAMRATDPVARLVGEAAYAAAGGRIERDLFAEDGDRWSDPEIAERLAAERMTEAATRIGEETGLAWIRPIAGSSSWEAAQGLFRVSLSAVPFSPQEDARVEAIETRQIEISDRFEEGVDDEDEERRLNDEYGALDSELSELNNRPKVLPDEAKPTVGAFLLLRQDGSLVLEQVYYSETRPEGDARDDGRRPSSEPAPKAAEELAPGGKPLSGRLADELAVHRRDVLAANLVGDPALALDFLLFALADDSHRSNGTTLSARRPDDPQLPKDLEPSRARETLDATRDALDRGWQGPETAPARFAAFRDLDDDAKAGWLASIVAASLQARTDMSTKLNPMHGCLAEILEIDAAQWWRPTAANFFDRVPKNALLSLLQETGGAALSTRHSGSKKTEISGACEKLFSGQAIVEAEVKAAALAWVPDALKFASAGFNARSGADDLQDDDVETDDETCINAGFEADDSHVSTVEIDDDERVAA